MQTIQLSLTPQFTKWLDRLPHSQFREISKLLLILQDLGHEIKMPHSKALGAGLFELKESHFGLRAYYGFVTHNHMILLKGGNKTSQDRDIKQAHAILTKMRAST